MSVESKGEALWSLLIMDRGEVDEVRCDPPWMLSSHLPQFPATGWEPRPASVGSVAEFLL